METITVLIDKDIKNQYGLSNKILDFKSLKENILGQAVIEMFNKRLAINKNNFLPEISDEEIFQEIRNYRADA